MNELDKLREMLTAAGIPYESIKKEFTEDEKKFYPEGYLTGNRRFSLNQIVYGRYSNDNINGWRVPWKFDGICNKGSYGVEQGLIETYGELGVDEKHNPQVMTAKEAFDIILKDWRANDGTA